MTRRRYDYGLCQGIKKGCTLRYANEAIAKYASDQGERVQVLLKKKRRNAKRHELQIVLKFLKSVTRLLFTNWTN
jgi:outer membrane translocation and assembly module TamA